VSDLPESAREGQACDCFIAGAEGWPHAANCASVSPAVEEPKDRRCICGNGEAEEDRGAVLDCAVHGFEARTEQARRITGEAFEVGRLREALGFYASEASYEWRKVTAEETPEWSQEDRDNCESSSVLIDEGSRARAALAGSPSQETK
jgi:hypothetical protein